MRASLAKSGCASSSCGSSDGPADMSPEMWERVKDHPCYSEEAHHYFARMHVAVAPACNIQCNYCNRKYDCANESRPGVVSERLDPDQAVKKVIAVANEVPQLSVLGIAGPGDACYDWRKTKETFERVSKEIPDLKLCLSTNGLALPDYVDEIADMAIDHVTITINAIDPEIGAKIYPWVFYDHRRWTGVEASRILLERQMLGLEMLVARDILVKVNSVMIPGINDAHLIEVNKAVKEKGAFLHNIMPLISDPAHGTHFGLTGQRGPTPMEVKALQDKVEGGTKLMRHCRQCRADAVGILGEDRGQEFTMDQLPETVSYDPARREEYRSVVATVRGEHAATKEAAKADLAEVRDAPVLLVAVATRGGGRINLHFGHAQEFQVFEVSPGGVTFVGHRKVEQYCHGGHGEERAFDGIVETLQGVSTVLCAKIGEAPKDRLEKVGIKASDAHAFDWIEAGIAAWYAAEYGTQPAMLTA
ncbi:nitrogenase cofactor biosynthesis protein NifB [Afifella marina]|nr:nitrogenase cofactor biosynthesis protein NifB [Afifella marina]MBK1622473.1 nitrogenase cofactor biosynthesis protein NifB [Afifella marina DSM 2698]MBK1626812.1 nitrogenase cofactor biosynthesis protein NifB [Afifella marina]MBK5919258.1 nitrogenase cofactor biosynthesis protein NifB [Afifella marina]RAI21381.1 nitrogenase cofactor biosynthesis protein NifB [Afifella marina DSM 2698]